MIIEFLQRHNNWAGYIMAVNLLFNFGLVFAYAAQRDYRRALYFFFAILITATVAA